jgi:hypothetical protein
VRHLTGTFATSTLDVPIPSAPIALSSSFLLFSTASQSGMTNDEGDFPTARIVDANTVRLTCQGSVSLRYSIQVVEFAGATVDRGTTTLTGTSLDLSVQNAQPQNRSFILYTARTDAMANNNEYICKRRLKARLVDDTTMTFSRGAGGGGAGDECSNSNVVELAWERVTLPSCGMGCSPVQHPSDITLNDTEDAGTATIDAVETHRSIVFFAGQGAGGQAAGEGNLNVGGPDGDNTGALHGRVDFTSATQVRVDRALAQDKAVFAPQVVQFDP